MEKEKEVSLEINGAIKLAKQGSMIIEVTDSLGEYVPRFCYHKELSIAANCRMCLVEVEGAPKPLPACATPVADGMKIWTNSDKARKAQHGTMEFLLINHPLDCPICDQGGECELQDLAVGYGSGVSQYTESKRVVEDKNIGPLIKTEMTRCIHCTRCVRFGEEIAGIKEMGAIGRGENVEIGTYIESSVESELSGNMIDVCPVGALTSKPYRYSARSWEMRQAKGIAPHDNLGSNINFHIKGQMVKRVVPRENGDINDIWISDRDRFSYEGLSSSNRTKAPKQKVDGRWVDIDWNSAVDLVINNLKVPLIKNNLRAFISPSSTNEEFFLLQSLVRGIGSNFIDHRLRQIDFSDDQAAPLFPRIPDKDKVENNDLIILLGAFPRTDVPIVNILLRNAIKKGSKAIVIDSYDREYNHNVESKKIIAPSKFAYELEGMLANLNDDQNKRDEIINLIQSAKSPVILFGSGIDHHPDRIYLLALIESIANKIGASVGHLTQGCNAAGAWLSGAVPHRGPCGTRIDEKIDYSSFLTNHEDSVYFLFGVDPALDFANSPKVQSSLKNSKFVVGFSAFDSEALLECCDLILPIATYAENEGSFINCFGMAQKFECAVKPIKDAKPGWKILRRLGSEMGLKNFEAITVDDVFDPFIQKIAFESMSVTRRDSSICNNNGKDDRGEVEVITEIPPYSTDQLLRNAVSLQQMRQSGDDSIRLNQSCADRLDLSDGDKIGIEVAKARAIARLKIDNAVPDETCMIFGAREVLTNVALNGARARLFSIQGDT